MVGVMLAGELLVGLVGLVEVGAELLLSIMLVGLE
jgi:hypothetical protein